VTGNGQVNGSAFSVGGSTLVVTGGNVGIGTTSPSTKLHVSGGTTTVEGIAFSLGHSTYSYTSNIMTTYEEGTWVPQADSLTYGAPGTYTTSGTYTKIGRMVYITGRVQATGGTTIACSANFTDSIGNLPFISNASDSALAQFACPNAGTDLGGGVVGGSGVILYITTGWAATGADARVDFTVTYEAAN
jgi:hypothetical protein